jgi:hypothetical protein
VGYDTGSYGVVGYDTGRYGVVGYDTGRYGVVGYVTGRYGVVGYDTVDTGLWAMTPVDTGLWAMSPVDTEAYQRFEGADCLVILSSALDSKAAGSSETLVCIDHIRPRHMPEHGHVTPVKSKPSHRSVNCKAQYCCQSNALRMMLCLILLFVNEVAVLLQMC